MKTGNDGRWRMTEGAAAIGSAATRLAGTTCDGERAAERRRLWKGQRNGAKGVLFDKAEALVSPELLHLGEIVQLLCLFVKNSLGTIGVRDGPTAESAERGAAPW